MTYREAILARLHVLQCFTPDFDTMTATLSEEDRRAVSSGANLTGSLHVLLDDAPQTGEFAEAIGRATTKTHVRERANYAHTSACGSANEPATLAALQEESNAECALWLEVLALGVA